MIRTLLCASAAALLIAMASPAFAKARGGGHGASAFAPGHMKHGVRGASAYAPGHLKKRFGSVPGHPGASGYAPGHRFR